METETVMGRHSKSIEEFGQFLNNCAEYARAVQPWLTPFLVLILAVSLALLYQPV
jgi:hypothetical protein